ncbi:hypothetical protein GCM10009592_13560 [Brachybacterium rhamnosum]|uniref:Ig-like domain-containing protein n=1 Tax=Brachybacterium rhamnosum TaxID=173361 RepID=A0ABW4PYT2_9MICO
MPEVESRRHIRRSRWVAAAAALLVVLLVVLVLVLDGRLFSNGGSGEPTAGATSSPGGDPSDAGGGPSDGGSSASDGGGTDAAGTVPFSAVEKMSMRFPSEKRTQSRSFNVEAGETYLLRFDVSTEKPADSPGNGFMLGVRLECTDEQGKQVATTGGTQNLLTGDPVTLTNQVVLAPRASGVYRCSLLANAPDAALAAKGTAFALDVTWKVTEPVGVALPAQASTQLPAVIPTGATRQIFSQDVPVASLTQRRLDVLASLYLTSCTGPGGSTEGGTQWCTQEVIDQTGSHYRFEVRYDVIGSDGNVCGTIDSGRREEYLDTYRHHQLYHVEKSVTVPADLCGDTIRTSVNLLNRGPAGLLVHGENTSMVTMETRPVG